MEDHDELESKSKPLKAKANLEIEIPPVPIAADGGIAPGYGAQLADAGGPAPDEDNFICLRGPCRHYWQMRGSAGAGNPSGTWEALGIAEPRQTYRSCLAHPGTETELSGDDLISECNRWDPLTDGELVQLAKRRTDYEARRASETPLESVPADVEEDS